MARSTPPMACSAFPRLLSETRSLYSTSAGLEPEELAGIRLPILRRRGRNLSGYNFVNELHQLPEVYPRQYVDQIGDAIMEAWNWMISHGLLAREPRQINGDWEFVTPLGEQVSDPESFRAFRDSSRFPRALVHLRIAEKAWANFIRGDYEPQCFRLSRRLRSRSGQEGTSTRKSLEHH